MVTLVVCAEAGTATSSATSKIVRKRRNMPAHHSRRRSKTQTHRGTEYNPFMNFGISTQIRRAEPVTVDLLESLRRVGYDQFELFCNRPHVDFHNRSLMRGIGRWFQENALPAPSLHLPFVENVSPKERVWISVTAPEARHREAA